MKAPKTESNIEFALCPEGTHLATLFKIIYIGTVEKEYKGQKNWTPLVRLYWELPNEPKTYKDKDGKEVETVFTISREMTFSMGEKSNLRKIVSGMIGRVLSDDEAREFDLDELLGKSCLLNVIHKNSADGSRKFAIANSTTALMKGMAQPAGVHPTQIIDVSTSPERDINFLHESIAVLMKSSKEWLARASEPVVDLDTEYPDNPADEGKEIPF